MSQRRRELRMIVMPMLPAMVVAAAVAMVATVPLLLAASQGIQPRPGRGDTGKGAPAPQSVHGCDSTTAPAAHPPAQSGALGAISSASPGLSPGLSLSRSKRKQSSPGLAGLGLIDSLNDEEAGGEKEKTEKILAVSVVSKSGEGTLHSAVSHPSGEEWRREDGAVAGASPALVAGGAQAPDLAQSDSGALSVTRQMASRSEARTPSPSLSSLLDVVAARLVTGGGEIEQEGEDSRVGAGGASTVSERSEVSAAEAVSCFRCGNRSNRKRRRRSAAATSYQQRAALELASSEAQAELLELLAELYAHRKLSAQLELELAKKRGGGEGSKVEESVRAMRPASSATMSNSTTASGTEEALNKWLRQRQEKFQALKNFSVEVIAEHPNRTINVCLDGPKILVLPDATDWLYCLTRDQWIEKLWADLPRLSTLHYPIIVLNILIFLFGTTGNIFVCLSVYRNHQLRSVTNYFIVNLAFADFLVILICLPATGVWDLSLTWFFGTIPCKLIMFLQDVSISVSVLTLTAISLDRYYAICHPLKFKSNLNQAKRIIVMIWIVSLIIMSPDLIYLSAKRSEELSEAGLDTVLYSDCNYNWSESSSRIFQFVKTILLYLIPCLLMIVAHSTIMRTLRAASSVCHDELRLMEQHQEASGNRISLDQSDARHALTGERAAAMVLDGKEAKLGRQRGRAASDFVIEFHLLSSSAKRRLLSRRASGSAGQRLSSSAGERSARSAEGEATCQGSDIQQRQQQQQQQRQIRFSETEVDSLDNETTVANCQQEPNCAKGQHGAAAAGASERVSFSTVGQLDELFEPRTGSLSSSTKLKMTMHNRSRLESREKAAKMLIAIAVIFAICYLPVHLINFLRQFMDTIPQTDMTSTISMLAHCVCYLNSAINPIIYNHMNSIFRAEFKRFLSCLCWRRKKPANRAPTASVASNNKQSTVNKANRVKQQQQQQKTQQQQQRTNEADEDSSVQMDQVKSALESYGSKKLTAIQATNGSRVQRHGDLEQSSCLTTVIEFGV